VAVTVAASAWSAAEQPAGHLSEPTRRALAEAQEAYERRFGRVFIICATGLNAEEILESLGRRIRNDPKTELRVAAQEQRKITVLRLRKLVGDLE
jgi:2-oxo-4-hydroxy-4-carboxy-5-ureidoimidazoline decarboxylase